MQDPGLQRSEPSRTLAGESVTGADRSHHRALAAGVSGLGRAEDPAPKPRAEMQVAIHLLCRNRDVRPVEEVADVEEE